MYARAFLVILGSAALVACSSSADDADRSTPSANAAELALTRAAPAEAIASPIEVARPGETKETTSPRQRLATRRHATTPAIDVATPLPSVAAHVHHAAESVDLPIIGSAGSGPSARETDAQAGRGSDGDAGSVIGRWPDEGRRPGITIRGGGNGLGPCEIHPPRGRVSPLTPEERAEEGVRGAMRPQGPVAINPQVPTSRLPAAPPRSGGSGSPF